MKLTIRVKPYASSDKVERLADGSWIVHVRAPAAEGKANERVVEVLADYFGKSKRNIAIRSGFKGRKKVVEID